MNTFSIKGRWTKRCLILVLYCARACLIHKIPKTKGGKTEICSDRWVKFIERNMELLKL